MLETNEQGIDVAKFSLSLVMFLGKTPYHVVAWDLAASKDEVITPYDWASYSVHSK